MYVCKYTTFCRACRQNCAHNFHCAALFRLFFCNCVLAVLNSKVYSSNLSTLISIFAFYNFSGIKYFARTHALVFTEPRAPLTKTIFISTNKQREYNCGGISRPTFYVLPPMLHQSLPFTITN